MMWQAFLLISFLIVGSKSDVTSEGNDVMETYDQNDVIEYMENQMNEYKLSLHKATQQKKRRAKRELKIEDFLNKTVTTYESQLYNITPWQAIPTSYPVELEPFQISHKGETKQYLAVVNYMNQDKKFQANSSVYVMNYTTERFDLLQHFRTSGGIDFEFADLDSEQGLDEKFAIFLDHVGQNWFGGNTYEKWFQLQQFLPYQDLNTPFVYRSKVRALGAKRVKVFSKAGMHYFVTANSYYEIGEQYHVKSTMHVKATYGYELVQSFATQGAQDVEIIVIDNVRYIIFANHQDNTGKVDIYSSVYREHEHQNSAINKGPFELYQRLKTHGARDFEYFSFDGHHYLAVANEYTKVTAFESQTGKYITFKNEDIDSIIYWWTGSMWVEWQRIPTHGAVKWTFFTSDFGDPMLVVANRLEHAVIFTYDPLRGMFKPAEVQGLFPFSNDNTTIPDVRSVMAFKTNHSTYLAVANFNESAHGGYNIFKLSFMRSVVPELDPTVPELISAVLIKMTHELEVIKTTLSSVLLQVTNNVFTKSTEQNIIGIMKFTNITIRDTLVTNNLLYRENVTINPVQDAALQAERLRQLLQVQEEKIRLIEEKLKDVVRLNANVTVIGHKTFTENITSQRIQLNKTTVQGLIDNVNLTDLRETGWSKSRDQILTGNFTFSQNITINGNTTVEGKFNGNNISSLLTTNTEQNITAEKIFLDNTTFEGDVVFKNSTLNGFEIPGKLVTRYGNQDITGLKKFTNNVHFSNLQCEGLIDGVNLTTLNTDKMTLTSNQTVTSNLVFNSGFTVDSDITVSGLVDGLNLTSFYNDIINEGQTQTIPGNKSFYAVHILKSLSVTTINNSSLDDVMTTNTDQIVTANMTFNSNVTIKGDIITNSTINELDISTQAVTTTGNFTIYGHKQVTSAETMFSDDITVNNLVDGVNLTDWKNSAVLLDTSTNINTKKHFENIEIVDNLNAATLNNINMNTVKENLISITENASIGTRLSFEDLTIRNNLDLKGNINNFSIPDDFVTLDTVQNINGQITFTNNTVFTTMNFNASLNTEDFTAFYEDAARQGANQTIAGHVTFSDDVTFNNLNVSGNVNGLSFPDDVITLSTSQNITGDLTFTENVTFHHDLNTHVVEVEGYVNGIDVYEMERTAIRKDRNQTINGSIIFAAGINCRANISVNGLINGVNLSELINTTVRVTIDQRVDGIKLFNNDVMFENTITSPGLVSDINLTDLKENLLVNNADQIITTNLLFERNLNVLHNTSTANESTINNVNFHTFLKNALRVGENNAIDGHVTYLKNVRVDNITSTTVNNLDVNRDILLVYRVQNITGSKHFDVLRVDNLTVIGLLNGFNLSDIYTNALLLNATQNIIGYYQFNNITVKGNTSINGLVNGVNLTEYIEQSVDLTSNQTIHGWKTFTNISFDNVNFKGLLNGVNMTLLADDVLMKTGNQTVCYAKNFLGNVTIENSMFVDGNVDGLVNGVDLKELENNAVFLDQEQVITGYFNFSNAIDISGNLGASLINGYSIPDDFMTTNTNQTVYDTKTFNQLTIQGNLNVNGTIDGIDANEVDSKRFTTDSDQYISGNKIFTSQVDTGDIFLADNATVNNLDLSEDLISTSKLHEIHGDKIFNNCTAMNVNSSTGFVNGVNLRLFNQNALRIESSVVQEISQDQTFSEDLQIIGNMNVSGFINGMKVGQPANYSSNVSENISSELNDLSLDAQSLCQKTTTLAPVSDVTFFRKKELQRRRRQKSATEMTFNGFQRRHLLNLPTSDLGEIHSVVINETVFVSIAYQSSEQLCGPAYILQCTLQMSCSVLQTIQSNAVKLEFFAYNDFNNALLVDHTSPDSNNTNGGSACPQIPEIYVFSHQDGTYIPHQTLNEDLVSSSDGTILNSTVITAKQVGKAYGKQNNKKQTQVGVLKGPSKKLIAVSEFDDEYLDIFWVNGTKVKDLVKTQRIKKGKGRVGSGYLKNGKSVLYVSPKTKKNGQKLKLYTTDKNGQFQIFQKLPIAASSVKFNTIRHRSFLSYSNPSEGLGFYTWQGVAGYQNGEQLQYTDFNSVENVVTSIGAYTLAVNDNQLMVFEIILDGRNEEYTNEVC